MEKPGLNFNYVGGGGLTGGPKGKEPSKATERFQDYLRYYYVIILKLLLNEYIALQTAFTRPSTQTMIYNVQGIHNFFQSNTLILKICFSKHLTRK